MYSRKLNSREPNSKEFGIKPAIYMDSNVTLVKFDEISFLEMYMKTHDVFHNLIQSISNHMVYVRRGTQWNPSCTKKKDFGGPSDTPA